MRADRWLWIAVVALVVGGAAYVWHSGRSKESSASVSTPAVAAPVAAVSHPPPMPPAAETDATVRKEAADLSANPKYSAWLQVEGAVQRFVSAVDHVADGESPRAELSFLAPHGGFAVTERHGGTFIDPRTYQRYDEVADVIASINVKAAARTFAALHPLLTSAYAEIGQPGTTLDGRLAQAIQELESVKAPTGPLQVVKVEDHYAFFEPALEALRPAEKHLLRMGPHNMELLQKKLRELSGALRLAPVVATTGHKGPHHG